MTERQMAIIERTLELHGMGDELIEAWQSLKAVVEKQFKFPIFTEVMENIYGAEWAVSVVDKKTEDISRKIYNFIARMYDEYDEK